MHLKTWFVIVTVASVNGGIVPLSPQVQDLALPELSGEYSRGADIGNLVSLTIADSRFRWRVDSDMGTLEEAAGTISLRTDGWLEFRPTDVDALRDNSLLTRARWLPVRWGERMYLINEDYLLDFVNNVNDGSEPRGVHAVGNALLRRGDESKAAPRRPLLPTAWSEYLLDSPVVGTITRLLRDGAAEVDLGESEGLKPGMILWEKVGPDGRDDLWNLLEVQEVSKDTSVVVPLDDSDEAILGRTVTSRPRSR